MLPLGTCLLKAQADASRFAVGWVRADGVLVPIATHDAGTWRPLTAGSQAARQGNWQFWPSLPSQPQRPLKILHPVTVPSHCETEEGFRIDVQGYTKPDTFPIESMGLATTGSATVDMIDRLQPKDARWADARQAIQQEFFRRENQLRRRSDRPHQKIQEPTIYVERDAPESLMYFTVFRVFLGLEEDAERSGSYLASLQGWMTRRTDGTWRFFEMSQSHDWDGKDFGSFLPTAAIHDRSGRRFWIGRSEGYEWESTIVLEASSYRIRTAFSGEGTGC